MEIVISLILLATVFVFAGVFVLAKIKRTNEERSADFFTPKIEDLKIINAFDSVNLSESSARKHDAILRRSYNSMKTSFTKSIDKSVQLNYPSNYKTARAIQFQYDEDVNRIRTVRRSDVRESNKITVSSLEPAVGSNLDMILANRKTENI